MQEKNNQILYGYWNGVRGERLAPRRFDIEPSRIAEILPDTFILERVELERFRFRLAGTRICELFGREFRGIDLMDIWHGDDRKAIGDVMQTVVRDAAVGIVRFQASAGGKTLSECEMILLPLVHTGDQVNRVLGALATAGRQGWAVGRPIEAIRLIGVETIWPDGRPFAVVNRMDRQSPFLTQPRYSRLVTSEHRAFRVYDGGRSQD